MESLFCGHAGCGHAGCGHAGCRHAGHRLPAIVYVKPKICDQCYFSYYPLPTAAYSNKKGKKEQCTIINTMCIVVQNLYALYVQLSEPLNSLTPSQPDQSLCLTKLTRSLIRLGKYAGPRLGLCRGGVGVVGTHHKKHIFSHDTAYLAFRTKTKFKMLTGEKRQTCNNLT